MLKNKNCLSDTSSQSIPQNNPKNKLSLQKYYEKLETPFLQVKDMQPKLLGLSTKNDKQLTIVDPETSYTLCTIKKPGLKISCYREDGRNCIKLQKYIDECQARPDFGFDQDQTAVDKEQKQNQPNMLQLLNDYQNQKALWSSVNEMKDVK